MPDFPRHLPKPLIGTSSTSMSVAVVQHVFSSGRTRQYRKLSEDLRETELSWVFSEENYADFQEFVRNDLDHGTKPFTIRMERGGYSYDTEMRMLEGGYSSKTSGGIWQVTMSAEELNPVTLSVLYIELSEVFDMPILLTGADKLHRLVHQTYPSI